MRWFLPDYKVGQQRPSLAAPRLPAVSAPRHNRRESEKSNLYLGHGQFYCHIVGVRLGCIETVCASP